MNSESERDYGTAAIYVCSGCGAPVRTLEFDGWCETCCGFPSNYPDAKEYLAWTTLHAATGLKLLQIALQYPELRVEDDIVWQFRRAAHNANEFWLLEHGERLMWLTPEVEAKAS